MKVRNFLSLLLVFSIALLAGCRTNLFSGNPGSVPEVNNQPQTPPAPIVVDGVRTSYADVVEKTSPAVVRIDAERKSKVQPQQFPFGDDDFFRQFVPRQNQQQRPPVERGMGSGVFVSGDGYLLTNHHVIDGADKITIQMQDGKTFDAKVVGSDPPSDLAVLKIENQNLPFLTLGNSDAVRVGDIVLAIGNPLGIGQTVTAGIISAKGRRTGLSDGSFEDFLQTDAPINRGNSGGALVNLNGELIGINSQILSSPGSSGGNIGIGFSIPSNMAKTVMEQLIQNGKVRRGMLGVNIQNITEDVAKSLELKDTKGVLVSNVRAGSAADKAGVKRGDIITAINGEKIDDGNVLRNKVAGTMPGTDIKLTVLREGQPVEMLAKLDEFSVDDAKKENQQEQENAPESSKQSGKLGLNLKPLTTEEAKRLQIPEGTSGLLVTDVDPNGAAGEEGIARGDVILEVNRQPVESLDDMQTALERSGDRPILLLVARRGQISYLTVTPK